MDRIRLIALLLGITIMLAACSTQPAPPIPTEEPVQSPVAAAPEVTALPTETPVPLGESDGPIATFAPDSPTAPADQLPTAPPIPLEPDTGEAASAGTVPTADCPAGTAAATHLPGQRFGVNIYPEGDQYDRVLDLARDLNAGWIRTTLRWSAMEPEPGNYRWEQLDALLESAEQRNLRVLLTVTESPDWATASGNGGLPDDPNDFGLFIDALASRAQGSIHAYEIWQNPNTAAANGGSVAQPGEYVEVLKAAYSSIKGIEPCVIVLSGALLPTTERDASVALDDLVFYRGLVGYNNGEFTRNHDIMALQLNTGGAKGKGKWPRENPGQSRNYYGHIEFIGGEKAAAGEADRHAWVVQVGYRTEGEGAVSPEEQAEFLHELYPLSAKQFPWISAIFVRDLAVGTAASGETTAFSLTSADGSPRPAYNRLRDYFRQRSEQQARAVELKSTDMVLLWSFTPFNHTNTQLIPGPGGAIYSASDVGFVWAVEPNGAFRGLHRISKRPLIGAAVDARGNLYGTGEDGALVALSSDGLFLWEARPDGLPMRELRVSRDGEAVYTGTNTERLVAHATDTGAALWSVALGGIPGTPTVAEDGLLVVGSSNGVLHAISPQGQSVWTANPGGYVAAAPIVNDDAVYVVTNTGLLVAFDRAGSERWRVDLGAEAVGLALSPDDTIYTTSADSYLHAVAADGQARWRVPINGGRPTAPVVAQDAQIYLGTEGGGFYVFQSDGTQVGLFDFQRPLRVAPLAGADGAVYLPLGKDDAALVAFGPRELWQRYRVP